MAERTPQRPGTHQETMLATPTCLAFLLLLTPLGSDTGSGAGGESGPQALRYQVDAEPGNQGAPRSVAVGDHGSLVVAGRNWTDSGIDFFATGSAEPILELRFEVRANYVVVAAADKAPAVAAFTLTDVDPDPNVFLHEPTIRFYRTEGRIEEAWTWSFPTEFPWYDQGGGVDVSADGKVILGWWDSNTAGLKRVVALSHEGAVLSEFEVPMLSSGGYAGGAKISNDGTRAVVATDRSAALLDLTSGQVLHDHVPPFLSGNVLGMQGIGISGDGRRYVTSAATELVVWEEGPGGAFTPLVDWASEPFQTFGKVDLSADGARLGYVRDHAGAFVFDVGLVELDGEAELFLDTWAEPNAYDPVRVSDLELNDDGSILALASFGDARDSTPEAVVYDEAGTVLSTHDLAGSATVVDLDGRGEVLAFGSMPAWGVSNLGGQITVADAGPPGLRITGRPGRDRELLVTLTAGQGYRRAILSVSRTMGSLRTPWGSVGLGRGHSRVLSLPLSGGGAKRSLEIDNDPSLAGLLLHFQGTFLGRRGPTVTNKVSVRLMP